MKVSHTGRALEVDLTGNEEHVVAQLLNRGLEGTHAEYLATAALRYAEEETESLRRRLVPAKTWAGMVVCRRHQLNGGFTWLMLKREPKGWKLDSALFD